MTLFEYLLGENIKNLIFDEENDRVLYPDSLIEVRLFENNISSYMQMDDYGKDEFWYLDRKEYDRLCKYNIVVPDRESGGADTINPIEYIQAEMYELGCTQIRYNTLEEVPAWAKETIQKLIEKEFLRGDLTGLNLSEDMIRMFVINDRAGIYDLQMQNA